MNIKTKNIKNKSYLKILIKLQQNWKQSYNNYACNPEWKPT